MFLLIQILLTFHLLFSMGMFQSHQMFVISYHYYYLTQSYWLLVYTLWWSLLNLCCDFNMTSQLNKQSLLFSKISSRLITNYFTILRTLAFFFSLSSSIKYVYVFALRETDSFIIFLPNSSLNNLYTFLTIPIGRGLLLFSS